MVLDFPSVVDAELVGECDLIERLLKQPVLVAIVPRPRELVLVKNAEFHGRATLCFEHDLFRKPVPTPHQGRGRLFPDHAPGLLLAKLSSLAGRVASAFCPESAKYESGAHRCAPLA